MSSRDCCPQACNGSSSCNLDRFQQVCANRFPQPRARLRSIFDADEFNSLERDQKLRLPIEFQDLLIFDAFGKRP